MLMSFSAIQQAVVGLSVLILWAGATGVGRSEPRHPRMHHALFELKEARVELKEAAHDFGGHRKGALAAVDAAITQIGLALEGADDRYRNLKVDRQIYKKHDSFPHIHRCLMELKDARRELKEAAHNFGGHRERALKDVDYAIEQLQLALKFARR
jgi:hypothetical protein